MTESGHLTSVGVSVGVWKAGNALQTPRGELLLDVAELDDLTAIILMALLFSLLPVLQDVATGEIGAVLLTTAGSFAIKPPPTSEEAA
jgi:Kef-type K+ transport system membrane component KefB